MRSEAASIHTLEDGRVDLHWIEHGDPRAERTVVCVHGLTRNAHDFDLVADAMARLGARILAVDVPGRGGSSWLNDPNRYVVPVYADLLKRWLDLIGLTRTAWIGTSMGGLIGMAIAAREDSPIDRLVLNDIGAYVPKEALAPIGLYLGLDLAFVDLAAVERHLRTIHAGFGRHLDDGWWRELARQSARPSGSGWRLHYDPAIRVPFVATPVDDIDLWQLYETIRCPTLVIRGADSALLPREVAERMAGTGPRADLVTFLDCGHAPSLAEEGQMEVVADWLCGPMPAGRD